MSKDFPQPICEEIWNRKYRLITPNPSIPDDQNVFDTWKRIAKTCSEVSPLFTTGKTNIPPSGFTPSKTGPMLSVIEQEADERDFMSILQDFNFLPAGRIIAGTGSGRNVTLFNCFVMGIVPDAIDGIFEMLKEAAITMQQGGGIGYDFSTIRPAGSPVKGVDADASGPLTFMDVWDAMCKTIMSAGCRRGAMMATIRCDHPDIEAFVVAKQEQTRLRMFNISIMCSDAFMKAVKADADWDLVHISRPLYPSSIVGQNKDGVDLFKHKTIKARYLWDLIMKSTYNYAEPGVLFIDTINQMNNLWYAEDITATNPCGEQPLPPYGACLLGSINLTKMIERPFNDPWVDFNKIIRTATIAVQMLDRVIDMSNFPLPQQKVEALDKRRMGIGITGMADMLFMMGHVYGSKEAAYLVDKIMRLITMACYEESIQLAKKYGACPVTLRKDQRLQYIQSGFMANMPSTIKGDILKHGIRNALLTSIAPTGTISLFAGNISSGIEPIFAPEYTRKILHDDGVQSKLEVVQDYAVHLLNNIPEKNLKFSKHHNMGLLYTTQTLIPVDHLTMMAAVQPWIDSSMSKTVNCPEDISFDNFQEIYLEVYQQGGKGCTTYRPNNVTGSVLSLESDEATPDVVTPDKPDQPSGESPEELCMSLTEPMPRPNNLTGTTYKLVWDSKSFYVTINDYEDEDGNTIPFEIFINSSEMANLQWTVALTRMISAVFRRGGQVKFIGEELKRISDPAGGFWVNKKFVPSFVALLGQTLTDHLDLLEKRNTENMISETDSITEETGKDFQCLIKCPECFVYSIIISEGCETCTSCGYSKCG